MTLETRTCACGCGVAFRVMSTSKQVHASTACAQQAGSWNFNFGSTIHRMSNGSRRSKRNQLPRLRCKKINAAPGTLMNANELADALGVPHSSVKSWEYRGVISHTGKRDSKHSYLYDVCAVEKRIWRGE